MKKRVGSLSAAAFVLALTILTALTAVNAFAADPGEITVLFTHDVHDYLAPTVTNDGGTSIEHGGAARLVTLLKENSTENTIYLDAGDFSMGSLFMAGYTEEAAELRSLGAAGCAVTTFGNHEFDYGSAAVADMLHRALDSGDPLPQIVQSNIDLSGDLTPDQQKMKDAFADYGVKEYTVLDCAGIRVGVFGLVGRDCIECIQTDLAYIDYLDAARSTVSKLEAEGCGVIIALSHTGTEDGGTSGEDAELAKEVPGIDLIVSGHTHSTFTEPVTVGHTVLVSAGEYLKYLGKITFSVKDGEIAVSDYALLPIDSTVTEDPETAARVDGYRESINQNYLADEGVRFDDVICRSDFDLISCSEMVSTHKEYNMGNLIADSYLYEARRNGIDDIDVAIVGYGTIFNSLRKGDITVADAFSVCSLGVGSDGSAGHPLIAAYITGKELKLIAELDASLGPMVSYIKMSYSGLSSTFNDRRILLDQVTDVHLVRPDGTVEEIEDDRYYKACINMYAANMLGMLNGLTKGILSVTAKYEDGTPVEDFYDVTLKNTDGREIKEWVALKNYLMSFEPDEDGVPLLPESYREPQGRKNHLSEGGWAVFAHPGTACRLIPTVILAFAALDACIVALVLVLVHRKKKKKAAGI